MSIDVSQYKVGVILSLEECGKSKGGKVLRACQVNVGDEGNPVTIVTAAANVREGSRLAVALTGSTILNDEGEEMEVKKTPVGGVMSDGMFCDSKMLGWTGGSAGVAQVIPDNFAIGSSPPAQKPRPNEAATTEAAPSAEQGLFEKKLTKEQKKKLAEERKKAREAKKAAGKNEEV
jgi:tRNA-binding EMAP/Myf-like protein